jgi:hypothetical protein
MGDMRNANKILITKPEEKRPLGRPRSRWEININPSSLYLFKNLLVAHCSSI